ncbi:hypothetical protein CDL15_Pgr021923 [Punica granatum]|uniref:PWWP domain-containing protein n=1 Tax=Punica granatum TaxID=22663 RepID=A0A218WTB9_PUNGR|nr:hypothetical protein CDL15_Pgr021923 [Punica granatum]
MEGGSGSGAADCSPGSIVWVRRRNGSWWPGKILGPEELSDSHLTSPRAGTPVKLLGREDASIDWYNLERSKRVKAFRCGEFDDCIEKVESSQATPTKKREKYASREDAILHALELEKELLRKQGKVDIANKLTGSKSSVATERSLVVPSGLLGNGRQPTDNPLSSHVIRRFSKDEIPNVASYSQKGRYGNEIFQEDGLLENVPRMRGLQDFGLKIATPKRKLPSSITMNGFMNPRMNDAHLVRVGDLSVENTSSADGGEEMGVICRAKRSRCMYLPQDHSDSLDDRENPRSMMDISPSTSGEGNPYPNTCQMGGSAFRLSGAGDYGSSEYYLSESEPDSSETGQNTNDEMTSLSEDSDVTGLHKAQEHGSMSSEEPECSVLSADASHVLPHDHVSESRAVSKWQLKRKRNIRNLPRRHLDATDRKALIGSSHRIHPVESGNIFGQRSSKWGSRVHYSDLNYSIDEADENEEYLETHLFRDLDYPTPRVNCRGQHSGSPKIIDCEDMSFRGARYDPFLIGRNPLSGARRPVLFEVDLKVQVSYQRERVPIVAVTSKLNGNSIIGHSIQIEAIEDGSSDHLLPLNHDMPEEAIYGNRKMGLPAAWRTARRTANFRVPRSNPSSAFDGDEDEGLPSIDRERKSLKSVGEGGFSQKGFLVRRSLPQMAAQQPNRKISKKLTKRVSLSSRQKIRTLSSIAIEQNFGSKCMLGRSDNGMGGLIEPGSSKPTTVACIPVKLVFSRLLEKINRPPSKAVANICRLNADCREK